MAKREKLTRQMFEHVSRQRESGMAVADYAKQSGITRTKLQYWIRKYLTREAAKDTSLRFIDLHSFGPAVEPSQDKEISTPQIILTFPNGMCLKIY